VSNVTCTPRRYGIAILDAAAGPCPTQLRMTITKAGTRKPNKALRNNPS